MQADAFIQGYTFYQFFLSLPWRNRCQIYESFLDLFDESKTV